MPTAADRSTTAPMSRQRELMEQEIARLQELRDSLDEDWARVRWFVLGFPVAVVLGFVLGPVWFWLTALGTAAFLATSAYLIRVRRNEYEVEIATVRRDLEKVD